MSVRNTIRSLPTLLQIGFSEAVAYRAEMLVWILSTTMPLIMLALWMAVAREAPIGRFGEDEVVAYFLSAFIVRQLTSAWSGWQMNYEVRQGLLSMRLLRPVQPLMEYAVQNVASMPTRILLALPVAFIGLYAVGTARLPQSLGLWALWGMSLVGAWGIAFLANTAVGCLSFFMESSIKVLDVYLSFFFVFSGYLVPVELFPAGLLRIADLLPFRYQLGFPVELLSGAHTVQSALPLLLRQWGWVAALLLLVMVLWNRGLRRFGAYGG